MREKLASDNAFIASYMDMREVRQLLSRHESGLEDGTDRIWRLMNLELWGGLFFRGEKDEIVAARAGEQIA